MIKKKFIGLSCVIFIIIYIFIGIILDLDIVKHYIKKLKLFLGSNHFYLTNQPEEEPQLKPISNTICHMSLYGTCASGKKSYIK